MKKGTEGEKEKYTSIVIMVKMKIIFSDKSTIAVFVVAVMATTL